MPVSSAPFKKARAAARMVQAALGRGWRVRLWTNVDKSQDAWHANVCKAGINVMLDFTKKGDYCSSACMISSRDDDHGGGEVYWTPTKLIHHRCPRAAVADAMLPVLQFIRGMAQVERRLTAAAYHSEPLLPEPCLDQEDCNDGGRHYFPYPKEDVEQYCQICGMQDTEIAAARSENKRKLREHKERLAKHNRLIAPLKRKPPKR